MGLVRSRAGRGSFVFLVVLWMIGSSLVPASAREGEFEAAGTPGPVSWVPLSPPLSPPAGADRAMAFDAAISKLVLFDGDTWTYDGSTWSRQSPPTTPPFAGGSMVYDAALGKIVLFAGSTWFYDGTTWTQQSSAATVPVSGDAAMAYDPSIGKVVLFGGGTGSFGDVLAQTWTYDGVTWTLTAPATSPPARTGATMAFDPAIGRLVLFGGNNGNGDLICQPSALDDTWTYDGSTWTPQSPPSTPGRREGAVMVFDTATNQLVLFGGTFGENGASCNIHVLFNDTWNYDGTTWTRLAPSVSPPMRFGPAAVYNPPTGQIILFGGESPRLVPLQETWAYQPVGTGYRLVASDGGVFAFNASFQGSTGNIRLNQPIVGMAANPGTGGYWIVARDGGIFAFNAPFFGAASTAPHPRPVVAIAPVTNGQGYWIVSDDGLVFDLGPGARRNGANGPLTLNHPIVGITADPQGTGYWLVASDGGIFSFQAQFHGSTGNIHLNQPIVGMTADPTGGYWLVARDGGIFAFDAPFFGSTGNIHLNQPIVGMTAAPDGQGYWLVASDGGIFSFGPGATFNGSTGNFHLNKPIVGMTGT
jgi:galactose oxidase-like protein